MRAVLTRLAGASVRAALVAMTVAVPAMMLPNVPTNSAELAILLAGVAAAFVVLEYGFKTPSLIEFRFAAPYNRFRFATLVALVAMLVMGFRGMMDTTLATNMMTQFARQSYEFWTFTGSPLQSFLSLANPADDSSVLLAHAAALALSTSLSCVVVFGIAIWIFSWPVGDKNFDLWMNIPSFGASVEEEAVLDLRQSGLMSVVIGLTLPYLAPQAASAFFGTLAPVTPDNSQFLVWLIAIWCFVPAVTLLRAVALYKVAKMVQDNQSTRA